MSTFREIETIDFYGVTTTKGDIMCNNGVKNDRLPIGTNNYVLTADSSESTGLKWSPSTGSASNNIVYTQNILTVVPISTNSTVPVSISQFQVTPVLGNYVIMYNLTYSMSRVNSRITVFGLYKNNVLIANSERIIEAYSTRSRTMFSSQYVDSFNGTDILTIKFNVNNTDTTTSISTGNLILLKFTNSNQYNSSTMFSTNSIIPVIIPDMTNTPINGVFLILFNCEYNISQNNGSSIIGLYNNGILLINRITDPLSNKKGIIQMNTITTFSGIVDLTVRVSSSNNNNEVVIFDRNLILIPLS